MNFVKSFLIIAILSINTIALSNPLEVLEVAMLAQEKYDRMNHEENLEVLDALNQLLATIDENLGDPKQSDISINDLIPEECEDVPVEELVCFHENVGVEYGVCFEDEYSSHAITR